MKRSFLIIIEKIFRFLLYKKRFEFQWVKKIPAHTKKKKRHKETNKSENRFYNLDFYTVEIA